MSPLHGTGSDFASSVRKARRRLGRRCSAPRTAHRYPAVRRIQGTPAGIHLPWTSSGNYSTSLALNGHPMEKNLLLVKIFLPSNHSWGSNGLSFFKLEKGNFSLDEFNVKTYFVYSIRRILLSKNILAKLGFINEKKNK